MRQVQDHPDLRRHDRIDGRRRRHRARYAGSLAWTDNTIVVFTSDNGGVSAGDGNATSNLPLRGGKGRQWEGGIREPYLHQVARRDASRVRPATLPVTGIDFYPTLLELAGLPARPDSTSTASALCRC